MKNKYLITIIVAVFVGAGAFFGGMKYQQSQNSGQNFNRQFQGQGSQDQAGGNSGQGRLGGGNRMVIGQIIGSDDKSITIKLPDGSSKIVLVPSNITVSKTDTGSKNDLTNGINVGVFGTDNTDGSITAQNIQLNPMLRQSLGAPTGGSSPR